jgi:hypothetical protein
VNCTGVGRTVSRPMTPRIIRVKCLTLPDFRDRMASGFAGPPGLFHPGIIGIIIEDCA